MSHNALYKAFGTDLQWVTYCTCGHDYEYHYFVGPNGGPAYNTPQADRCPGCDCSRVAHDGAAPVQLKPVGSAA